MSRIKIGNSVYENVRTIKARDADDESKYIAFSRVPEEIKGAMNVRFLDDGVRMAKKDASLRVANLSECAVNTTDVFNVRWNQSYTDESTTLTGSMTNAIAGQRIFVAITTRSDFTLSDGWTLISTSEVFTPGESYTQTLSFAYKIATNASESITVTQQTKKRIYITMVQVSGVTSFTDNGYTVKTAKEQRSIDVPKPSGWALFACSANYWLTDGEKQMWSSTLPDTDDTVEINSGGSTTQPRQAVFVTRVEEPIDSVTFTVPEDANNTEMAVGCLTLIRE